MKLISLSDEHIKYSINDDGTLIIKISNDYLLKISWGELRSLDMIISDQQFEAMGAAKKMIKKMQEGLELIQLQEEQKQEKVIEEIDDNIFNKIERKRFQDFLNSYLNDEEPQEVFMVEEIKSVLGKDFILPELEEEFGSNFKFKDIGNDQISVAILS